MSFHPELRIGLGRGRQLRLRRIHAIFGERGRENLTYCGTLENLNWKTYGQGDSGVCLEQR